MTWVGHVVSIEERKGEHNVLVEKPEGNKPLGRPRRGSIILKCIFKTWYGGMD
jgi:hypothetical protein